MKTDQLIGTLLELNPELEVRKAKRSSHYKVVKGGRMVGIIPVKLAREGLAANTRSQFRREGILLPSERKRNGSYPGDGRGRPAICRT